MNDLGLGRLTDNGLKAIVKGDVIYLGKFFTRGLNKDEMFKNIEEKQLVGTWCPNLFDKADFQPTHGLNFKLVVVCKPKDLDKRWDRKTADTFAKDFGFGDVMPTIEMAYYLWEGIQPFMRLIWTDLSCLVVCHQEVVVSHQEVNCKQPLCNRVVMIDNKLVVSGGISGPGHHFGEEAGFVYVIPE
jgi:hypothetical protein